MGADGASRHRGRWRARIGSVAARVLEWSNQLAEGTGDERPALQTLRPGFKPDQHKVYVDHLNAAVNEGGVCNIALTGRYGAGKSSVLTEFARQNKKRVLFLSLSTLGPDSVEESRTNQIQKELVKQLLHREKPSRLPQSRYQRIDRLPVWRAFLDAAAGLGAVALMLWLFGVFPEVPALTGGKPVWTRVGAGAVAAAFAVFFVAWIRLTVHNRLVVSAVSAGGASITLAKKSESYFDQYLDEIVYFFESMRDIDIVVFEDLDRFDEPGIFETLRELNTLLNSSKQGTARAPWRKKRTIRFVYALRDSIFEKLGHDTKELVDDAATAESARANRTKFFDLVIPIVPFITHRTSRELMSRVLEDKKLGSVPAVSDELIDLVARHTPDMRLLTNIRNEYAVFARRLITEKQGMHTLTPDQLFAMVVYKNIHLEDFEHMLLGRSKLDTVYQESRNLVTEVIATKRARLRAVTDGVALDHALATKASRWGQRLEWFFNKAASGASSGTFTGAILAGDLRDVSAITTEQFWREVLDSNAGLTGRVRDRYGQSNDVPLTMAELQDVVNEGLRVDEWERAPIAQLKREEAQLLADLALLRSADFKELAQRPDFTLKGDGEPRSLSDLLEDHIESDLGRALISEGFIDRYYTLYVAQYYGRRVPPNAMNFIVQNVDTNRPDINYPFNDATEIAAVLRETKKGFLGDISGYNIGILDYLLERNDAGAHAILDRVIRHIGDTEQAFLDAYFPEGTQAAKAVAYLAKRWPTVFTQVIETIDLPHTKRIELVDAALANTGNRISYAFDEAVHDFLQDSYPFFRTIAQPTTDPDGSDKERSPKDDASSSGAIRSAITTMKVAGVVIDNLAPLRPFAVRVAVENDCYTLTAANLRTALGDPDTLSLDRIHSLDPDIYQDVIDDPGAYLKAIATDAQPETDDRDSRAAAGDAHDVTSPRTQRSRTPWSVDDPAAFLSIVSTLGDMDKAHQVAILERSRSDCRIDDLQDVPPTTWEALAKCNLFPATLENTDAYIAHLGELDNDLANILTASGKITAPPPPPSEDDEADKDAVIEPNPAEEAKIRVAETILDAPNKLPDAKKRAELVASLRIGAWLPISKVPPEHGQLLGELIRTHVCADEEATFMHFDTNHWPTLSHGIQQSTNFAEFVSPTILNTEMTASLLRSSDIDTSLKHQVLSRFSEFIPSDHSTALVAAADAAISTGYKLTPDQITTIVQGTGDGELAIRLVHHFRKDVTTQEAMDAVVQARIPYGHLTTAGSKLTFPNDAPHKSVFKRFQDDGYITFEVFSKGVLKGARIEVEVR